MVINMVEAKQQAGGAPSPGEANMGGRMKHTTDNILWAYRNGEEVLFITENAIISDEFAITLEVVRDCNDNPVATYRWVYILSKRLMALIQTSYYDPRTKILSEKNYIITRWELRMMTPQQRQMICEQLKKFAKEHGISLKMTATTIVPGWLSEYDYIHIGGD